MSTQYPAQRIGSALVVVPLVLLIALLGLYLIFKPHLPTLPTSQSNTNPTTVPANLNNSLVYFADGNLHYWKDNSSRQITTSLPVRAFDHHTTTNKLAYIYNTNPDSGPSMAILYDLNTNQTTQIHEIQFSAAANNPDYRTEFKDIRFSPDGSLLALTSNDSIWTYDIKSKAINQVVNLPVDPGERGIVYALANPLISPDNKFIFFVKGYYEGASQSFVNLSSKAVTDPTDYSFYTSGQKVINWLSPSEIIVHKYDDVTQDQTKAEFQLVSFPTLTVSKSFTVEGNLYSSDLSNRILYLLTQTRKDNGKKVNDFPILDSYVNIIKLDMNTGEQTILHTALANYEPGIEIPQNIRLLNDNQAVLQIFKSNPPGEKPLFSLSLFNLNSPSSSPEPFISPGSLTPFY